MISRIVFFFISVTFLSCEYENTELNFKVVEKQTELTSTVKLNLNDTLLYLCGSNIVFDYQIDVRGLEINNLEFLFDSSSVFISEDLKPKGRFILKSPISEGEHYLKLNLNIKTKGNSLASTVGKETIDKQYVWHVIYTGAKPEKLQLTSVVPFEGHLKISWEKSKLANFTKYTLMRIDTLTGIIYSEAFNITNREQNYFIDTTFIGGENVLFYVNLYAGSSFNKSSSIVYSDPLKFIIDQEADYGKVTLHWTKCNYPGNFKGYSIYGPLYRNNNNLQMLFSTTNINDTSFNLKDKGIHHYECYEVYYFSKKVVSTLSYNYKLWSSFNSSQRFQAWGNITKTMFEPYYFYSRNQKYIKQYDPIKDLPNEFPDPGDDNNILKISPDNGYLISGLYRIDINNYYKNTITDYIPYGSYSSDPNFISLAKNGVAAINFYGEVELFDFKTMEKNIIKPRVYSDIHTISPNGKYLIAANRDSQILVYGINNLNLIKLSRLNAKATKIVFIPDSINSEFIIYDLVTKNIQKWSCDQLKIIKSVLHDQDLNSLLDIDPISRTILINGFSRYSILSIEDLSLKKNIDKSTYSNSYSNQIYFLDSTMFTNNEGKFRFKF